MMDRQTPEYFRRRARQEQVAANEAVDERAARPHRELADEYRRLASGGQPPQREGPEETPASGTLSSEFRILP